MIGQHGLKLIRQIAKTKPTSGQCAYSLQRGLARVC